MPLYEYTTEDGKTSVLVPRPVDLRDAPCIINGVRLRRRTVPSRITIGSGARPETMGDRLTKGYRHLETTGQLADRPGYLPAKTIRQAIATPDVHD